MRIKEKKWGVIIENLRSIKRASRRLRFIKNARSPQSVKKPEISRFVVTSLFLTQKCYARKISNNFNINRIFDLFETFHYYTTKTQSD